MTERTRRRNTRAIALAARRQRVLDLRCDGLTLREIAAEVGVSHETVREDIAAALSELHAEQVQQAERLQTIELRRLDRIERKLHQALVQQRAVVVAVEPITHPETGMQTGERERKEMRETVDLAVVGRLLEVSDRRRKLLGIDAPVKVEHSGTDAALGQLDQLTTDELAQLDVDLQAMLAEATEQGGNA